MGGPDTLFDLRADTRLEVMGRPRCFDLAMVGLLRRERVFVRVQRRKPDVLGIFNLATEDRGRFLIANGDRR